MIKAEPTPKILKIFHRSLENLKSLIKFASIREWGAGFADSAVLFPLILSLSFGQSSLWFSFCLSAGILYITSALIFRIAMPVQPLKSIAVGAMAMGASQKEIAVAAGMLGAIMLICVLMKVHNLLKKVPEVLIHGLQAGLGILLLMQSAKLFFQINLGWDYAFSGFALLAIMVGFKFGKNLIGIVALMSVFASFEYLPKSISESANLTQNFRSYIVAALVLPQIFLTLGNSVAGTASLAQDYYGELAKSVTTKRLLLSIGIGNLFTAIFTGLPFCHGAGGLTAHYRAGAQSPFSTASFGFFLILLAVCSQLFNLTIRMDQGILSLLLGLTGFFHLQLARKSFSNRDGAFVVVAMIASTWFFQDLLKALAIGIAVHLTAKVLKNRVFRHSRT